MKIELKHIPQETASDDEMWKAYFIDEEKSSFIISPLTKDQYGAYKFLQSQLKEMDKELNELDEKCTNWHGEIIDLQSQNKELREELSIANKTMGLIQHQRDAAQEQLEKERELHNEIVRIINEDVLSLVQYSEPRVYEDLKKLISKTK